MPLLPLITFLLVYLGISLLVGDFYKVPITVAFLLSGVVALFTMRGKSVSQRLRTFSQGAASESMMLMIWIFILAGAFANSAREMGCIDSTVSLALAYMPAQMLMAGLFLAACFISLSVGTSVGTVVALVPISTGLAQATGMSVELMAGVIVGGAFFGDNLSFISDTTVVATQTQGCRMSDKFRMNLGIALPAAIGACVLYVVLGSGMHAPAQAQHVEMLKVLPYLAVLVMAACGVNVLVVLSLGCLLTGVLGMAGGAYDVFGWMKSMSDGMLGMSELIIVTMLAGGMLAVVKENGGIDLIINTVSRHVKGRRGAELAIAFLVTIVNFCTANNTVAIITVGPIVRNIAQVYHVDPRRSASLLDTFSCFAQGIIPYGAQLLMAGGLAGVASSAIVPYLFYPYLLGLTALIVILIGRSGTSLPSIPDVATQDTAS